MKTTVELPDDLYRRAKAEAALRGQKFKELVEEGLGLVLATPRHAAKRPRLADLMKPARGMIASGRSGLAEDAAHYDPAIGAFLTLIEKDIRAGRRIGALPQSLARAMRAAARRRVDLDEPFEGDVAL